MDAVSSVDVETVKSDLMTQLSAGTGLKQAANPANRPEVNEILLKLERHNPTESPAESPLLNGVWELLYTGGYGNGFFDSPTRELALLVYTGGYRPGLVANLLGKLPDQLSALVEIDDLELTIKRDEPRVASSAKITAFGQSQTLKLTANLASETPTRLRETVVKADSFGRTVELPGPLRTTRALFVTYLDDDLLVARDETGVPDVWLRKPKEFWSEESEKMEATTPVATVQVLDPEVDPTKEFSEPGWEEPKQEEDVGPSDY